MKYFKWLAIGLALFTFNQLSAQGPPITGDKPIMLGGGTKLVKVLVEHRRTPEGNFTRIPLMLHYLPTSNSLIALHVPFVGYQFDDERKGSGLGLGDIQILGKYQFFRKDKTGKTFRMIAKVLQTLGTGDESVHIHEMMVGGFETYLAVVAGYESLRYGISNELGLGIDTYHQDREIRYKLGFGLPLKKQVYPVDQVNLYFEYQTSWFMENDEFMMLYAQGIQYAKGQFTYDLSVQAPLRQRVARYRERDLSIFIGTRFAF